ncbi:MAG: exo-alpha-sialidase [Caldilineaceae bacterium]|nr:exo-alpha-sialidase [Caldilineaceae bacterium]
MNGIGYSGWLPNVQQWGKHRPYLLIQRLTAILLGALLLGACRLALPTPNYRDAAEQITGSLQDTAAPPAVLTRLPLAAFLEDLLFDSTQNRLYVTDQSGTLTVFDGTDYSLLATVPTMTQAQLTLSPNANRLYLSPRYRYSGTAAEIQLVDTATLTVSGVITNASHLTLDAARNQLIVGNALLAPASSPTASATSTDLRVLDAATLAPLREAALTGIPVYNPARDELLLVAHSLYRVNRASLTIVEDLFPDISAQPCGDCVGARYVEHAEFLPAQQLLAVTINSHTTPSGGGRLPIPQFYNAATLELVQPQPVRQATCGPRIRLQPPVAGLVYRHQAYASTYLFHNWYVETATGQHLRTLDGLDAPFVNARTAQAYAGGWALALPEIRPLGRLPTLTCIWDENPVTGHLYAQSQNELLVLAEAGLDNGTRPETVVLDRLPANPITAMLPTANSSTTQTLFVIQEKVLYRSTDGGVQWQPLTSLPLYGVMPLHAVLSPTFATDQTIIVGGGNTVGPSETLAGGVFRSTDGGTTWQPLWHGLNYLRIKEVAFAGNTLLAYADATDLAHGFSGYAVQRSEDQGLHWSLWLTTTNALTSFTTIAPTTTVTPTLPLP